MNSPSTLFGEMDDPREIVGNGSAFPVDNETGTFIDTQPSFF